VGYAHDDGATAMLTTEFDPSELHVAKTKGCSLTRHFMSLILTQCIVIVLFLASSPAARAENFYISQSGGPFSGGSACNGKSAQTAAWFNTAGNNSYPKVAGKIGPGDTVYVCGTWNLGAGATLFQLQVSGTNASPITLKFDTGAQLLAQYWFWNSNNSCTDGGAINSCGQNWWVIDGGTLCGWSAATQRVTPCNGTIQNTAMGTGLTYVTPSTTAIAITGSTSNLTIQNLDCHNIYQRNGNGSEDNNQNSQDCVRMEGNNNYITIKNSVFHDVPWTIVGGTDYITEGPGLELYNSDHNIQGSALHFYIYGNHFHDWAVWDSTNNAYHHDAIHCYGSGAVTQMFIYNNYFDGSSGNNAGMSYYLLEAGGVGGCMGRGGTNYFFNNVAISNQGVGFTMFNFQGLDSGSLDNGDLAVNNLFIGSGSNTQQYLAFWQDTQNNVVENNAWSNSQKFNNDLSPRTYAVFDYNAYQSCNSSGACWSCCGINTGSWTAWKANNCTGTADSCDQHGIQNIASSNFFSLPAACMAGSVGANCAPAPSSPLIKAGGNLSGLCNGQPRPGLGDLCYDITGRPRPSSGNGFWDIGPFQSNSSSSSSVSPPSGLAAVVQTVP